MELVYRLGRLDVSRGHRVAAGLSPPWCVALRRSLHPARLVRLFHHVSLPRLALRGSGRESVWRHPRCYPRGDRWRTADRACCAARRRWRDSSDTDLAGLARQPLTSPPCHRGAESLLTLEQVGFSLSNQDI